MEKRYFKNIDFLRFVFAIIIVTLHMIGIACSNISNVPFIHNLRSTSGNMRNCVELFFIISGFFLMITLKKDLPLIQFLKNKFIRLSPVIIFTVVLFLIALPFRISKFYFMDNLFSIFFINGISIVKHTSPFGGLGNVHSSWYISVLVFVSLFYFYIIKNYGLKLFNLVIPIIIILGLHVQSYHIKTVFSEGLIRGFVHIGIGILLGEFYLQYKDTFNRCITEKIKIWLFTFLECGVFGYLLYGLITKKSHLQMTDLVFLFVILFILFIYRGGYLSRLLDNNLSVKLGSYAYSIYITHCLWLDIFKKYWFTSDISKAYPQYINGGGIVLSVAICALFGALTYYLVERPCTKYLKKKFNKGA